MVLYQPDILIPLLYAITAIPFALLGLYAWRKRPAVAVNPFAWGMLCLSIWSVTYGLEVFFKDLSTKLLIVNFEYIGIVGIPVLLLVFAIEFTGKSQMVGNRARLGLWGIPVITVLLVWTNPLHNLMWKEAQVFETAGLHLLQVQWSGFFWVHAIYSYALLLIATLLLVMELIQRPGIYRVQISLVIAGILLPLVTSLNFALGGGPIQNLDPTPLSFLPASLGLTWAIIRYRLLEIMPPEHLNMLRNMKDGVIVLNPQQRMLYVNPTAESLFNCTEDEAIGQPVSRISEVFENAILPHLDGGEHQFEFSTEVNGNMVTFEVNISPVVSRGSPSRFDKPDIMVTLHDITHRKKTEAALSRRGSIMSAISMAAEKFLKTSLWEQNIPGVLESFGRAADVSSVSVYMNYLDSDGLVNTSLCYEWAAEKFESQLQNPLLQHVNLRNKGLIKWEQQLSQGIPIQGLVRDMPREQQEFLQHLGSLSIAILPIRVEDTWWGFIVFEECCREREWSSMELDAFQTAAAIFGAAEERARTEQRVIVKQNSLNLLNDIVRQALEAGSLHEMAQNVVDRLAELIHADGSFLTQWDEHQRKTIPLAAYGPYRDTYPSLKAQPGVRTLTESALTIGHTLMIEDAYNSPYVDIEVAKNFTSRSEIVFPLISGARKLGALIFTYDRLHTFQQDEINISEQAAKLIALAFEKFLAMDEAKQRADTSETLRKAGMAITEKLELDHTVSHILEQLHEVVPYDSASVQLLKEGALEIMGGRGWNDDREVIGLRFPIPGHNPNTVVMNEGKTYYLPDTWEFSEDFRRPPHDHIRSWLGVPLIVQDKVIGLLAIDSAEPNDFTEADINIASEFANQVAGALENARLFSATLDQALTDPLTNVQNRRGLYQLGEFEFERARRIHRPFSVLMFDIDHFKTVNDTHGHAVGDEILQQLASRARQNLRAIDLIGRYGGEEFIIALPETNLESTTLAAERLRQIIIRTPFQTEAGELKVTVSIGVAEAETDDNFTTLVQKADFALYEAKRAGRNRVVLFQDTDQT